MRFNKDDLYNATYEYKIKYLRWICYENEFKYITYEIMKKIANKLEIGFRPQNLYAYLSSINKKCKTEYEKFIKSENYIKLKRKVTWFVWNSIWFNDNEQMKKEEQDLFDYYGYTEEQYQTYLKYKAKYMPKRQKEYFEKLKKDEEDKKQKIQKLVNPYTEEEVRNKIKQLHEELKEIKALRKRGCLKSE